MSSLSFRRKFLNAIRSSRCLLEGNFMFHVVIHSDSILSGGTPRSLLLLGIKPFKQLFIFCSMASCDSSAFVKHVVIK